MEFCKGKDVFVSLPTGYGKTLIFAVLPSLFNPMRKVTTTIRQALFAYAASVRVLHPAAQLDASASVLSHFPISPFISLFIAFLWYSVARIRLVIMRGWKSSRIRYVPDPSSPTDDVSI